MVVVVVVVAVVVVMVLVVKTLQAANKCLASGPPAGGVRRVALATAKHCQRPHTTKCRFHMENPIIMRHPIVREAHVPKNNHWTLTRC